MKVMLPLLLVGMILGMVSTPSESDQLNPVTPELSRLFQKVDADHILLLGFTDRSINNIPDSASSTFYRKRGKYRSSAWSQRVTDQIAEDYQLKKLTEWPMTEVGVHCGIYLVPATMSVANILQQLSHDERVEIVQQMHFFNTKVHRYNDPYFKLQANMQQMQIDQAHVITTGRHVTIAMIDTGVALDHPDLIGQIIQNENFAADISASFSTDKHGTAVAGIMVAKKDNGTGITGVAPDAKLIALKACWPDQADAIEAVCNSLTLALAVNAAIRADVNILNMSLTGPYDPFVALLLTKAIEKGIIVVAANAGVDKANESFPASLKNVIAVQSQPQSQEHTQTQTTFVTAPGEKILTTLPHGTYDFISGSSIAAAEVSGIIALLMELKPDLNLAETKAILQKSKLPSKKGYFSGINANTAVLTLCETTSCPQEMFSLALEN